MKRYSAEERNLIRYAQVPKTTDPDTSVAHLAVCHVLETSMFFCPDHLARGDGSKEQVCLCPDILLIDSESKIATIKDET
ncbi:hypothetical protein AVEN_244279-1 [Araneus ventricosus]|uniref:Uncharacterized protein n=1 Tax=Araneus ventricosus TaxID=182803 RepID=A0A4Y2LLQ6_ARAVE|nr:hypothetical protein AVEN_244279-1 [Araneus ventricosus]